MLAQRLAEYVCGMSYRSVAPEIVHEVKRRLLDSLGCAYGAFHAPPAKIARKLATDSVSSSGATVWGTTSQTRPELAAFANGTLVRYLDFNDTYLSKEPAHPSDNIPPCLATAEFVHASGKRLILAILLAYEIQCRLCDAAALRPRGWDHVTYGPISTSLAAAKLLRLSVERTRHAVNLAGITAGALRQTRVGEVSFWKACAFANAAKDGVFAAWAAKHGMTGPPGMFEGEKGFMNVISGKFSLGKLGGQGTTPFKIRDTYIKYYPVEYHAQSAVSAACDIRQQLLGKEGKSGLSKITHVAVGSFDVAIEIIGRDPEKWRPKTRETADHSLPYCVAVSLLDGKISPASFSATRLRDTALRKLIQKVEITEIPEFTDRYPKAMPTRIRVTTAGGRTYTAQVDIPKGHPKRPLTDTELMDKFHRLIDSVIGATAANRLAERIWELDRLPDAGVLVKAMPQVRTR